MKNIWTQHLERSNTDDRDRDTTFTRMLHSLVKSGADEDYSTGATLFLSGDMSSGEMSYSLENNVTADSDKEENRTVLDNDGVDASYNAETEVAVWTAKSQRGHELGLETCNKDSVRLIMTESGRLFLRYDVAGEETFEMSVRSEEEASQIIEEDNATTGQLYPDNPELKWIKINLI